MDSNTVLALLMYFQQAQGKETAKFTHMATQSINAMDSMRERRLEDPGSIIIQRRAECMQKLNTRANEPWALRDNLFCAQPDNEGHCNVGRAVHLTVEIIQLLKVSQADASYNSVPLRTSQPKLKGKQKARAKRADKNAKELQHR